MVAVVGASLAQALCRPAFTGRETIDSMNVHRKGRVYDPRVGLFLSPDEYEQVPTLTKSSYHDSHVKNTLRPYTDKIAPSGVCGVFLRNGPGLLHQFSKKRHPGPHVKLCGVQHKTEDAISTFHDSSRFTSGFPSSALVVSPDLNYLTLVNRAANIATT